MIPEKDEYPMAKMRRASAGHRDGFSRKGGDHNEMPQMQQPCHGSMGTKKRIMHT